MGLKMSTGSVKSQLVSMNKNLQNMIGRAELLQNRISSFTSTQGLLIAASYDSIREYYSSVHLPLVRGFICYAEGLCEANNNYMRQIDTYLSGIGEVDQDGLEDSLASIIRMRERLADIEEWTSSTYTLDYMLERMQRSVEDKLNEIDQFLSASAGCYAGMDGIKNQINAGINCLKSSAFNSATNKFIVNSTDMSWNKELEGKWNKREPADLSSDPIIDQIKKEHPNISEEEINIILQAMAANPKKEGQSAESYLKYMNTVLQELPGITVEGAKIVGDVIADIYIKHGNWLEENAANILKYSNGTMDDMLKYTDDIAEAAGFIRKGQTLTRSSKVIPVIGTALDFGLQVLDGENVGDAAIKTGAHVAIGAGSTAIATLIVGSTPVGLAAVITVGGAYFVGKAFDYVYDNYKDDIVEGVKKIGRNINNVKNKIGDTISGFLSGVAVIFE